MAQQTASSTIHQRRGTFVLPSAAADTLRFRPSTAGPRWPHSPGKPAQTAGMNLSLQRGPRRRTPTTPRATTTGASVARPPGSRRRRFVPLLWAVLLSATLLGVTLPAAGWDAAPGGGPSTAGSYEPQWSWPLSPEPAVVRPFEAPPQRWLAGHRGVDLAAPPGTPVLSPAAGTVTFAGWVVNRPVLTVDLGDGLLASFEPVVAEKSAGDPVAEGEVLGRLADPASAVPGHCAASCLHWGVRLNREYVNPLKFVTDRRPSVLLPLR